MSFAALIDERHDPPLRETLGVLLASARTADIAISHLRLAGLDLQPSEAGGLQRCRVMVGRFDAAMLHDAGTSAAGHDQLRLLAAFAQSGRLEMRTAPHHTWNPDFSVFQGLGRTNPQLTRQEGLGLEPIDPHAARLTGTATMLDLPSGSGEASCAHPFNGIADGFEPAGAVKTCDDSAALLGAHYFGRPYPMFGLAFTCVLRQPHAVRACSRRFEELWAAGYDILPVIADTLAGLMQ